MVTSNLSNYFMKFGNYNNYIIEIISFMIKSGIFMVTRDLS